MRYYPVTVLSYGLLATWLEPLEMVHPLHQNVIPARFNALQAELIGRDVIEQALIGPGIDPPKMCSADIGQTWTEPISQQPEQAEHRVAVRTGMGADNRGKVRV